MCVKDLKGMLSVKTSDSVIEPNTCEEGSYKEKSFSLNPCDDSELFG